MPRIHISLQVSDLERAVRFYDQMLGKSPDKRRSEYANYRVDTPGLMLALVEAGAGVDAPGSEHRHYGVELDSAGALEAWRERISATELNMRREDDVVCCYARADKFWLSDPDGNQWEFWVRTADAESMYEPPPDRPQRTSCCT